MPKSWKITLVLAGVALALVGCSEEDNTVTPPVVGGPSYVGAARCADCHSTVEHPEYTKWVEHGHASALMASDGAAPTNRFPDFAAYANDPVAPPTGYTWSDVSYALGGFGWKMLWVDDEGYVITGVHDNQYNFGNDTRSDYEFATTTGTKTFDCGRCHTTGWVDSDDGVAENNQGGLAGVVGTFAFAGVQCEVCHGMGSVHAASQDPADIVIDATPGLCGRCHTRGHDDTPIAAADGFVEHNAQFDEWSHSPHNSDIGPGCVTCHDPHSSVKLDNQAEGTGLQTSCTDCHTMAVKHNSFPNCVTCHMPRATRSAVVNAVDYQGDIKTHIWKINTAAVGKDDGMFNAAGTQVLEDGDGLSAVTLDFACYSCHKDSEGVGGGFSTKTLQQLSDYVLGVGEYAGTGGIHSPTKKLIAER